MMLAYLITQNQTIGLVSDDSGMLRWQSDVPELAERAARFVSLDSIPESGGNQAAWAVRQLERYMPGTTGVLGGNVSPGDARYGMR